MKKIQKTNAMRFLDQHKMEYKAHTYEHKENDPVDGIHVHSMTIPASSRTCTTSVE